MFSAIYCLGISIKEKEKEKTQHVSKSMTSAVEIVSQSFDNCPQTETQTWVVTYLNGEK